MRQTVLMSAMVAGTLAGARTGPTYYTPGRVAAARENIERYDWARAVRRRIFETGDPISYYTGPTYTPADLYAARSDEFLWNLQPPTTIPRVVFPHESVALCPIHGAEVKKISPWCPWRIDPIEHPFQIQCLLGKEWYPSNRYLDGDMTSGPFPDDGSGCLYQGTRYFFLREYAHMVYGSVVIPTLRSLSQAYQLTGDTRYARKGCILLARLALEYPNYGWDGDDATLENRFERTYLGPWNNRHPHYTWKQGGMITDLIWETFCLEATAYAYDGLRDYMDRDPDMLAFLRARGLPVESGDQLRQYIETYVFRAAMRALLAGWIRGNEGFHQAAALAVALVLDDFSDRHPNSADMVEYAYRGLGRSVDIMRNGLLPDGGGHESPNYNLIKLDFIRVARLMETLRQRYPDRFPADRYPDLFGNPKARALFDHYIDILVSDGYYPSVGDCGGLRDSTRRTTAQISGLTRENVFAVERFGDPRHARACLDEAGNLVAGELWEPYPEARIRELAALPEAAVRRETRLLDPYGVAILESGDFARRRSAVLNFSSLLGHRQLDTLNLELYARQLYLLQDLGYPRTWEYRWQWDANSLAHNTVTVDETQPSLTGAGGRARLFASAGGVHVVTASHQAYRGVTLGRAEAAPVTIFERTVVMVDVDPDRFYLVDLFAVNGGEQHDQSWHAFAARPAPPPLAWDEQKAGTLAGEDVPRFAPYTDRWGRAAGEHGALSCFADVRRARLTAPACWTWEAGTPEKDALRLHLLPLGGPAEVVMARGRSPVREDLDYVLVRRRPPEPGAVSRFLSVLDPCQGEPQITGLRVAAEDPLTLELEVAGQTHRLTLNLPPGDAASTAHRELGLRLAVTRDGAPLREVRIGTQADTAEPAWDRGTVERIEAPASCRPRVTVRPDNPEADRTWSEGRWVRVFGENRSTLYRILRVEPAGEGRLALTLDKTLLLAEGPLAEALDGTLRLDAYLLFARTLAGALTVAGDFSARLDSASQDGTLSLAEGSETGPVPPPGTLVRIFEFGPGAAVEAPRIAVSP